MNCLLEILDSACNFIIVITMYGTTAAHMS